ncbi:MAG: MG2 domain-containing protein [Aquabacterium sp.]|jgi:alpha-2-macroglobulin|uniref:alpha-2-macroglobulin family protein n=1 Tax=Aquabacterium sp. TaxID=1872578 RepID=UPI003BAF4AA9
MKPGSNIAFTGRHLQALCLGTTMWMALGAQAATVVQSTPQGEVRQVRQVVVRFDQAVVPLGDLRQEAPYSLACQGAAPKGEGRWVNDRQWVYDFEQDLGPGVRCQVQPRNNWRPAVAAAGAWTQAKAFSFQTGGPAVLRVSPSGGEIEEQQHWLLTLNGPALPASLQGNAWCEIEGVGERVPLVAVTGAPREAVLKSRRLKPDDARQLLVHCQRPLPNQAAVRLVWGAGIAAQSLPQAVTRQAQQFNFTVRPPFEVEFSCEREKAQAPCLPLRPLTVRFSSPVPRALAEQVRVAREGSDALKPWFDKDDKTETVEELTFKAPLPENANLAVVLPAKLKDTADRTVANAHAFPMALRTGGMPPLAKFATAPFGVVELESEPGQPPLLPITVRHVEADLGIKSLDASKASLEGRSKTLTQDIDILRWIAKVQKHHETSFTAKELGSPASQWKEWRTDNDGDGREIRYQADRRIGSRELSLLNAEKQTQRLKLPPTNAKDTRPFEVVGIPLPGPGYHVIEVASPKLGASLLAQPAPMYVRTGVLVSNLGVHLKLGRENSLVWVTTLDKARPVAGADVTILNCRGESLWAGRTDAQGRAVVNQPLAVPRYQGCIVDNGLFVSARKAIDQGPHKGKTDLAFAFSDWNKGVEPWRFNVPTQSPQYGDNAPEMRVHTVTDRALLRAGETVSMKHFARLETRQGLAAVPRERWPTTLRIIHSGSGDEITQPLSWRANGTALSTWAIPQEAKLGVYEVYLSTQGPEGERRLRAGQFRVEEFRLPLIQARVAGPKELQVSPTELPLSVQMSFLSGGGFGGAPGRVSALLRERSVNFAQYDEFNFEPPRAPRDNAQAGNDDENGDEGDPGLIAGGRLIADKLPLVTDREGNARLVLPKLPPTKRPMAVQAELSFNDPNGEVQTVSTEVPLWPSQVVLGLKTGSWASTRGQMKFQALALDTTGKPIAKQDVKVIARVSQHLSTRKRIVGGFYSYDNRTEVKELGTVCSGQTDARGLLLCEAELDSAGEVELVAQAKDVRGNATEAATTVWVTRHGELWFSQDNDDRMDVLPEKKRYEPGETARLQVRMPYREATVLVTVEREGVIDSRVLTLKGDDPTIELPIPKATSWAPNVFVSVMALRGRVHEVPWYSFFTWGWRKPLAWWHAFWNEGREYQAPTAMVDLSRPSFKLGVAQLHIGRAPHELDVAVTPDKQRYSIRQTVRTKVRVTQGGQPVQGEVAFAAVDEALLALADNPSWKLLDGLLQDRPWGVETSTAQNEIIGRRHYGRKAIAPGGGGGHSASRELFDTLLLWRGDVALDANGEAVIEVPLNDSLTSFRLVAIAQGPARLKTTPPQEAFGTGSASVQVSQDLQMLSGLPPLVREGDRFDALFTLRNTTGQPMKVRAELKPAEDNTTPVPAAQDVDVPAQGAREVRWTLTVPVGLNALNWQASATTARADIADRLTVKQQVQPVVPERVLQATLRQLDAPLSLPVQPPADGLTLTTPDGNRARGGVRVEVQPKLTGALPGLRRFFETYPYVCLEQQTSKAVGLKDQALWDSVAKRLPTYLDSDGLALYFPPSAGDAPRGSDRLTAYILAATHEAGFSLPDKPREQMLEGLTAFVQGRVIRTSWSPPGRPQTLNLAVRKLAAIEALSRHGRAEARMLDSITLEPQIWPTAALIDWLNILQRVDGIPSREQRLAEAENTLRARLTYAGTTLKFSTETDDFWWWLMDSADANAARLILAVIDRPGWKDELPRLVTGSLGRQRQGAWLTTTANLWGSLALDKFSQRFENVPVTGSTVAQLGSASLRHDWSAQPQGGGQLLPWQAASANQRAPITPLTAQQQGAGKPWLTVQTLAAIPLKAPLSAGYRVQREVSIVDGDDLKPVPAGPLPRGTLLRVRLVVDAQSDMTWVALNDPIPAGAAVMGSGLGRDSALATRSETQEGIWPAYIERRFDAYRAYYEWMPKGRHQIDYTVRLNNPGRFQLPPTRIEALYAPESFGESPNGAVEVRP